jgi:hypothetical protein
MKFSMEFHGMEFMEKFHGKFMENSMKFHGIPWISMEFHEIFHESSWENFHENNPSDVYGKFHKIPWNFP